MTRVLFLLLLIFSSASIATPYYVPLCAVSGSSAASGSYAYPLCPSSSGGVIWFDISPTVDGRIANATAISNLTTTVNSHTSSISSLTTTVNSHTTSISDLTTTVNSHTTSLGDINASITTINSRLDALEAGGGGGGAAVTAADVLYVYSWGAGAVLLLWSLGFAVGAAKRSVQAA